MILYVRLGCHLCDEAWQLLVEMAIPAERVNIDRYLPLKEQYGLLIPVLYDPLSDRELIYPFGKKEIADFLTKNINLTF